MVDHPSLDLQAYLFRIGYSGPLRAELGVLEMLHGAHSSTIPFENLDVMLGRPIALDLGSLQSKLVQAHRGGYCFEHNTLFAAVLQAFGFELSTLEARVRPPDTTEIRARTHMVLRVDVAGRDYLVDVGFGGDGPYYPVPMDGSVSEQGTGEYRVVSQGLDHTLQMRWGHAWRDLYVFTLRTVYPIDYEVANHYTSTHPHSQFLKIFTAQIKTAEVRYVLRGRTYSVGQKNGEETSELSEDQIIRLLRERFGLRVADAEIRRVLSLSRP